jgi:hypothetical protein
MIGKMLASILMNARHLLTVCSDGIGSGVLESACVFDLQLGFDLLPL